MPPSFRQSFLRCGSALASSASAAAAAATSLSSTFSPGAASAAAALQLAALPSFHAPPARFRGCLITCLVEAPGLLGAAVRSDANDDRGSSMLSSSPSSAVPELSEGNKEEISSSLHEKVSSSLIEVVHSGAWSSPLAEPARDDVLFVNCGFVASVKRRLLITSASFTIAEDEYRVCRAFDPKKYQARVVGRSVDFAVTALTVDDDEFWKGLKPVCHDESVFFDTKDSVGDDNNNNHSSCSSNDDNCVTKRGDVIEDPLFEQAVKFHSPLFDDQQQRDQPAKLLPLRRITPSTVTIEQILDELPLTDTPVGIGSITPPHTVLITSGKTNSPSFSCPSSSSAGCFGVVTSTASIPAGAPMFNAKTGEFLGMYDRKDVLLPISWIRMFINTSVRNKYSDIPRLGVTTMAIQTAAHQKYLNLHKIKRSRQLRKAGITAVGPMVITLDKLGLEKYRQAVVALKKARAENRDTPENDDLLSVASVPLPQEPKADNNNNNNNKPQRTFVTRATGCPPIIHPEVLARIKPDASNVGFQLRDVILSIEGKNIQETGRVNYKGVGKLPCESLIMAKLPGELVEALVVRKGKVRRIFAPLLLPNYQYNTRTYCPGRYVFFGGGLFTVPVGWNTYQFAPLWRCAEDEEPVLYRGGFLTKAWSQEEGLVLSTRLRKVNGVKVLNLNHFFDLLYGPTEILKAASEEAVEKQIAEKRETLEMIRNRRAQSGKPPLSQEEIQLEEADFKHEAELLRKTCCTNPNLVTLELDAGCGPRSVYLSRDAAKQANEEICTRLSVRHWCSDNFVERLKRWTTTNNQQPQQQQQP